MHMTNLRKVGGSIMLAVPPAVLEMLKLDAGARVGLDVKDGQLIVAPQKKPLYTMEELLAASDYMSADEPGAREWVDAPAVGREML
jgi:antitoxin ChpS